jgi:hypothetical protein
MRTPGSEQVLTAPGNMSYVAARRLILGNDLLFTTSFLLVMRYSENP